ncbi:MAG: CinA family nicotinamide mononucleotide deamidase-related protein, partial [Bacteroidales bacterium]|nr:CinA family nicotinamide mononucleotide deamidase-related protein [Bacteroidales bacterium]
REDILGTLREVTGKADVVLITGGLGPTSDDITKHSLCEFFNTKLVTNPETLGRIEAMLRRRSFPMNENNRRQAEVPESCRVLKNEAGTAPGMWFEKENTIFISMPGVPAEMKYLMKEHVIPDLKQRFISQVIIHKTIMTYGEMEARLAELLTGFEAELPLEIKLAYLPSSGIIKLRLTATGTDRSKLQNLVNAQTKKLYKIIPQLVIGEDVETFEEVLGMLLRRMGKTVCTAESCTGGKIATMLTALPGSSAFFKGSVIAYDNSIKRELLGVENETLEKNGAVSRETVEKMAEGAKRILKTDYAVATSGIAGPDGGTDLKPVGTLWMAVASEKGTFSETKRFGLERDTNINRFSVAALHLLWKAVAMI